MLQTGIDLAGAQAQRGGDAEQGGDGRQDIDGIPPAAMDAFPQQRIEHGANAERLIAIEGEIGEGEADQGVNGPGMQSPMEERGLHGVLRRRHATRFRAVRGGDQVVHGFGDTVKQQADAHARAEQHGEPPGAGEFRFGVGPAQPDMGETAESQVDDEAEDEVGDQHEKPAGLIGDPGLGFLEDQVQLGQVQIAGGHKPQDQQRRDAEYPGVQVEQYFIVLFVNPVFHALFSRRPGSGLIA